MIEVLNTKKIKIKEIKMSVKLEGKSFCYTGKFQKFMKWFKKTCSKIFGGLNFRFTKSEIKPSQFDKDPQIREETDVISSKAVDKKLLGKSPYGTFRNLLSKETIKQIAVKRDLSIRRIYQLAVEKEIKYNSLITPKAALLLVLKEQIQKAPICRGTKNDGNRCKKSTWDETGLCYLHRQTFLSPTKSCVIQVKKN